MIKVKKETWKEIFRFIINGGISFVVDYAVLFILTEKIGLYYLLSAAISFALSVLVNYIICIFWVFQDPKTPKKKNVIIFFLTSVIGLVLNQLLMWVMVSGLHIYYMVAKIIATLIVMVWNYISKKKALSMQ